jgi:hypothetical protein
MRSKTRCGSDADRDPRHTPSTADLCADDLEQSLANNDANSPASGRRSFGPVSWCRRNRYRCENTVHPKSSVPATFRASLVIAAERLGAPQHLGPTEIATRGHGGRVGV